MPDGQGGTTWAVRPSVTTLDPPIPVPAAWGHDVTGDGQPDLLVPSSAGVTLWPGRGDYGFETKGRFVEFLQTNGSSLPGVDDFEFTFLDANNDGLTDALLSLNGTLGLYLNQGDEFRQTPVPAFLGLGAASAYPVALDATGSGEEEVTFVVGGKAKAVRLTQASTGLLTSADDGKGNRASFEYARAGAAPGIRQRPAVLAKLRLASGVLDDVEHAYDYETPVTHSVGRFFVGFGRATRVGPLAAKAVTFHHDDDLSGVVLTTRRATRSCRSCASNRPPTKRPTCAACASGSRCRATRASPPPRAAPRH